jgi:hypothetical protein
VGESMCVAGPSAWEADAGKGLKGGGGSHGVGHTEQYPPPWLEEVRLGIALGLEISWSLPSFSRPAV